MSNFSRDTFGKLKHYVGVRLQQGVPLVDADWNEQEDIRRYELQAFLKWFVGNGVPKGNDGFRIISIVDKIILTSKKNDVGVSSVGVKFEKSTAAKTLGFGPSNFLASRAAPPAAQLTGEIAGPFEFKDEGLTLVVSADGMEEKTVTFKKGNFTAAKVVEAINNAMSNLTASTGTDNDFDIKGGDGTAEGAGRCLVEGWDAINESNLRYTSQSLYENKALADKWGVAPVSKLEPPAEKKRTDMVYLDVWEREVDSEEDVNLVNSKIGVETCVRLKREWVVRVKQGEEGGGEPELPDPPAGHVYYPLAMLTRMSGKDRIVADDITDLRFTDMHLAVGINTTGIVVFPEFTHSVQNISNLIDPGLGPGAISVRLGLDYSSDNGIFVGHSQASDIFGLDHVLLGALIEPQSGKFRVGIKVPNLETPSIRVRWWAFKPRRDIGEVIVLPEIYVAIDPETVTLDQGARKQFRATVTGTTNKAVTWRVDEGSRGGSVSDTGLYTAPNRSGTFHVRATSKADSSKYAMATITVKEVSVAIDPETVTLDQGARKQFRATVTGTTNKAVTWRVDEGSRGGSVSVNGLYTAPNRSGTFHVRAISKADSSKYAMATITVKEVVSVAIAPTTVTVLAGKQQQFRATVTGTTNKAVTWRVDEGPRGGRVSDTGLYTAPNRSGTFHVRAISKADTSKYAMATITVREIEVCPGPRPGTICPGPRPGTICPGPRPGTICPGPSPTVIP